MADPLIYSNDGAVLIGFNDDRIDAVSTIDIPDGVTSIGSYAFQDCFFLKDVSFPDSLREIGLCAFSGCTLLESATLPDSVEEIGSLAFSNCPSLVSVVLPGSISFIGWHAFDGCSSLKSVIIPGNVKDIKSHAFNNCSSLEAVIIPKDVTKIGEFAFAGCTLLSTITMMSVNLDNVEIGKGAFKGVNKSKCSLLVPPSAVDKYRSNENFKHFKNIMPMDDDGSHPCSGCLISHPSNR